MPNKLLIVSVTVLATLVVTLLVMNLSLGNKPIDTRIPRAFSIADPRFKQAVGSILTPVLEPGNSVQSLLNGDEIFPAMLTAIRSARRSITLETYIYWSGQIGHRFSEALRERAQSGVRVHVLLDWVGGDLDESLLETMRAAGIEIRRYNPPRWFSLGWFNNRTHRKLMVVDGQVGFIGGVGLADKWSGNAQGPEHWRDTHFRVEGPVVAQMQSAFIDNWLETTGEVLQSAAYFPFLQAAGPADAQVFSAAPGGGNTSMQLLYLMSITAAAESIDLSAAYFIPDEVAKRSLIAAAERGVRVRIIVPGPHMDMEIVRRASRANWESLLASGVQIFEYQPTMFHCKVLVVDGLWTSVGSTNFDSRSFSVNDEANMNVYNAGFAQQQIEIFERDLQLAERVTMQAWKERPWWQKALDWAASQLSSQL